MLEVVKKVISSMKSLIIQNVILKDVNIIKKELKKAMGAVDAGLDAVNNKQIINEKNYWIIKECGKISKIVEDSWIFNSIIRSVFNTEIPSYTQNLSNSFKLQVDTYKLSNGHVVNVKNIKVIRKHQKIKDRKDKDNIISSIMGIERLEEFINKRLRENVMILRELNKEEDRKSNKGKKPLIKMRKSDKAFEMVITKKEKIKRRMNNSRGINTPKNSDNNLLKSCSNFEVLIPIMGVGV